MRRNTFGKSGRCRLARAFDETYFEEFYDKLTRPTAAIFDDLPVHYDKTGQLLRRNAQTHTIDVLLDFQ